VAGPLTHKRALVTGGSKGIGGAIAVGLARAGADVVVGHRGDEANASQTVAAIMALGRRALAVDADVSEEADAIRLVETAVQHLGGLDILVQSAGINKVTPTLEASAADFDRIIGVNLRGLFLVGREAARVMVRQGQGGRIINIASELAYAGFASFPIYCASKGGVLSLTRSWAREFAPHILVNAIAPGPIDTDLLGWDQMSPEKQAREAGAVVLGRIGKPEELAGVAVFLAGPDATYVTGQCYGVNGGAVMT
jgi:3-oxoacyl-[acyl-carrier protein] reductase